MSKTSSSETSAERNSRLAKEGFEPIGNFSDCKTGEHLIHMQLFDCYQDVRDDLRKAGYEVTVERPAFAPDGSPVNGCVTLYKRKIEEN